GATQSLTEQAEADEANCSQPARINCWWKVTYFESSVARVAAGGDDIFRLYAGGESYPIRVYEIRRSKSGVVTLDMRQSNARITQTLQEAGWKDMLARWQRYVRDADKYPPPPPPPVEPGQETVSICLHPPGAYAELAVNGKIEHHAFNLCDDTQAETATRQFI